MDQRFSRPRPSKKTAPLKGESSHSGVLEKFFKERLTDSLDRLRAVTASAPTSADEAKAVRFEAGAAEAEFWRSLRILDRLDARRLQQECRETSRHDGSTRNVASSSTTVEQIEAEGWRTRMNFDPEVSRASPVIQGTWITAEQVLALLIDGWTWADLLRAHPELAEDDIRACLAYAIEEENGRF